MAVDESTAPDDPAAATARTALPAPNGATLHDVTCTPLLDDAPAPPRLQAMWDSVLLAYMHRGCVMPPA